MKGWYWIALVVAWTTATILWAVADQRGDQALMFVAACVAALPTLAVYVLYQLNVKKPFG